MRGNSCLASNLARNTAICGGGASAAWFGVLWLELCWNEAHVTLYLSQFLRWGLKAFENRG